VRIILKYLIKRVRKRGRDFLNLIKGQWWAAVNTPKIFVLHKKWVLARLRK
jgi:hypothetical protein